MKNLNIYQKGSVVPIKLIDDDNSDLDEYSKKVSSFFESKNVVILKVSSGSLIIRPNTVLSIFVSDNGTGNTGKSKIESPVKEIKEEHIDSITEIES